MAHELSDLLPDRNFSFNDPATDREERIQEAVEVREQRKAAQELARLKYAEKLKLRNAEAKLRQLEEEGLVDAPGSTLKQKRALRAQAECEKNIKAIELMEAETAKALPAVLTGATASSRTSAVQAESASRVLALQGTTNKDVTRMLQSLNINLGMQLSKKDTTDLLACLLTCNEAQLNALYNNKKIPIVIKTIIKRLREDADKGSLSTIEMIWDKVFGKMSPDVQSVPAGTGQTANTLVGGLLPNEPLSREAYILIRDRIISG